LDGRNQLFGQNNIGRKREGEVNLSPSPCESQRTGFDSDWQIPKIASRGIRDHLGDEFSDGVLADDENNGEKLPEESDEEEVWRLPANPNEMMTLLRTRSKGMPLVSMKLRTGSGLI
jgi:hypothetical protein